MGSRGTDVLSPLRFEGPVLLGFSEKHKHNKRSGGLAAGEGKGEAFTGARSDT